jgi:hypothetical protein
VASGVRLTGGAGSSAPWVGVVSGPPRRRRSGRVHRLRGALGVLSGIEFLVRVKAAEIPGALLTQPAWFGGHQRVPLVHLLLFRDQPVVAGFVCFDHSFFEHALKDGQGPPFIFAVSPFAIGPAADFPDRHKLARKTVQIGANLYFISIHNVAL